ncbi:MAG: hypothetical protein CR993_01195 [Rhodobacterales bacterium]|nr:MAG: hypothetical protein CR993_01195 [Rhodobacterales bacterium]
MTSLLYFGFSLLVFALAGFVFTRLAARDKQDPERTTRSGATTPAASRPPLLNNAPDERSAWGLLLQSPFMKNADTRSWLGGLPCVPKSFTWPVNKEGKPQYFLAQIDLNALTAPAHWPRKGALLVFFSTTTGENGQWQDEVSCHLLTEAEMTHAVERPCPKNLPPLTEFGFFHPEPLLNKWPVTLVPFISKGEKHPPAFAKTDATPAQWINNWAMATLEADLTLERLEREVREASAGKEKLVRLVEKNPDNKNMKNNLDQLKLVLNRAPDLISKLREWRDHAAGQNPLDPVNSGRLAHLFQHRRSVAENMLDYPIKPILDGSAKMVWAYLRSKFPNFDDLPEPYRPFAHAQITGWRGHRLLGIEPEFANNWEDLSGQDCLISIAADRLLGTVSEHEYGMSVWCQSEKMARGQVDHGQLVRHCAV